MTPRALGLQIAVGLGLLGAAFVWLDVTSIATHFRSADPWGLVALVALVTFDRLLTTWKWWCLLRAGNVSVGLGEAVRAYYISSFAGIFLPMTVGADVVRASLLRHRETARVVGSILVERGIGLVVQTALALTSAVLLTEIARGMVGPELQWSMAALLSLGVIAVPTSFVALKYLERRLPEGDGFVGGLRKLTAATATFRRAPAVLALFSILTFGSGLLRVLVFFIAARTIHIDAPFTYFLATAPLALMIARLPISLGGIGVLETSFGMLAYQAGIDPSEGFATALLAEAVFIVGVLPGAFLWRRLTVAGAEPKRETVESTNAVRSGKRAVISRLGSSSS